MNSQGLPRLIEVKKFGDPSIGHLAFIEDAPFSIARVYWTYGTPPEQTRGHHAHRRLDQLIFAVAGRIHVRLENLKSEVIEFDLTRPDQGLFVPPVHWRTLTFSPGAVMMCLASLKYDEAEYIRDYEEFKSMRSR